MKRLATIVMLLPALACATNRIPPQRLHELSLNSSDIPVTAADSNVAQSLAEVLDLKTLGSYLRLNNQVLLSLRNAGYQAGYASAQNQETDARGCASSQRPCLGRPSVLVYRAISIAFFSPDGAAKAMQILQKSLTSYSPRPLPGFFDGLGEEYFAVAGAPGSLTPVMVVVWRRANIVMVLERSPESQRVDSVLRPARILDARLKEQK
jgi:hypothetical protein